MTRTVVTTGGIELAVETHGPTDGFPVVLLHGLAGTRDYVIRGSDDIERAGFQTVAYDARGHGDSTAPVIAGDYDYKLQVDDLLAVMDVLEVDRAVIVGISMGAHTALRLALDYPQRVAGIVAVTPGFDGRTHPGLDEVAACDRAAAALRLGGIDAYLSAIALPSTGVQSAAVLRMALRHKLIQHRNLGAVADAIEAVPRARPFMELCELAAISVPTLVVGSNDEIDPAHPIAVAEAYASVIPGARFIQEAPGGLPLSWDGVELGRLVRDFVLEATAGGARGTTVAPSRTRSLFPHRRGAHCGTTALASLMEFHGLGWESEPLAECDVFGIAGGLGLLWITDESIGLPVYMLGRSEALERDFCTHIGASLELRQTDDSALADRWLRSEIEAGYPTMAWADIAHLDYLDVHMQNANHVIVVVAIDDDTSEAIVSDFGRDALDRCSLASLAAARSSESFPRPARNTLFCIRPPDELPDRHTAVTAGVRRSVANMRGKEPSAIGEVSGMSALSIFAEAFSSWRTLSEDVLGSLLYRVWFCVAKAGTGGGLFRALQADFLERAGTSLDDPGLSGAAQTYREISKAWTALADAVRNSSPRDAHRLGLFILRRIEELEMRGVEELETWLARGETT